MATRQTQLENQFNELTNKWKSDTRLESSVIKIVEHPCHQALLELGPEIVPLIVNDLRRGYFHWAYALHKLTGHTPSEDERVDADSIREAWLKWADNSTMPVA